MPLSNELRDVLIEFQCPACSHPTGRTGSWLKTIASFTCDSCMAKVRIGYDEEEDLARGFTVSDNGIVVIAKAESIEPALTEA